MKSHVSMEQHQCPVCGDRFDTGNILMHKRLKPELDTHTTTGTSLCPACQKLSDDGYLALAECDEAKSAPMGATMKHEDAHRTGNILHIRRSVAAKFFDREVTVQDTLWFIDQGAFAYLRDLIPPMEAQSIGAVNMTAEDVT